MLIQILPSAFVSIDEKEFPIASAILQRLAPPEEIQTALADYLASLTTISDDDAQAATEKQSALLTALATTHADELAVLTAQIADLKKVKRAATDLLANPTPAATADLSAALDKSQQPAKQKRLAEIAEKKAALQDQLTSLTDEETKVRNGEIAPAPPKI